MTQQKTLRRSLRGEDVSASENKKRFIHFLGLEIPSAQPDASTYCLRNAITGNAEEMNFGEVVYAIRCMIHENENLNAAESVDYHILLDWSQGQHPHIFARVVDERFICNGFFLWNRLREVLSKFITGIECMRAFASGASSFSMTIAPPLGSIAHAKKALRNSNVD